MYVIVTTFIALPQFTKNVNSSKTNKKLMGKVLLLGDGAVGKTSILNHILDKKIEETTMTIGLNVESATYELGANKELDVVLTYWDLGGQPQFRFFQGDFTKKTNIYLLVYDVSRYGSFLNLETDWLKMMNDDEGNNQTLRVLVANKCDLENKVSDDEAQSFAEKNNMIFSKVSAKTGKNIESLINLIVESFSSSHINDES